MLMSMEEIESPVGHIGSNKCNKYALNSMQGGCSNSCTSSCSNSSSSSRRRIRRSSSNSQCSKQQQQQQLQVQLTYEEATGTRLTLIAPPEQLPKSALLCGGIMFV